MSVRYLVVPQWQGSPSARAMTLVDGAVAIAGDLPESATTRLDVPLEAGDAEGTGIHRHSSLRLVRERVARALEDEDSAVVTVGGDCGVSVPAIAHAASRHPHGELAVVWFDAHADANSVESSPSGAFAGMAARALVDEGLVPADRLVLAGTRAWDDAELAWSAGAGVRRVDAGGVASGTALLEAVAGADAVYLHLDLDVLDPAEFDGLAFAEPFGVSLEQLLAAIRGLLDGRAFAGATIAGFAPHSPERAADDLATVLRILGALRPVA